MVANVRADAVPNAASAAGEVIYRPMTWADMDAVVEEYDRTWGYDSCAADTPSSMLVSRHFVLHYLEPATRVDIAERDGRFMGVVVARVAGQPAVFEQVGPALAEVDGQLEHGAAIGARALCEAERWHQVEWQMEAETGINETTQGELELFLVAGAARGRGVGGTLWRRVNRHFAACGVTRYYLHTDSSCDIGFYDHQGMERVTTRLAADHPEDPDMDDLYLYAGAPMAPAPVTAASSAPARAASAEPAHAPSATARRDGTPDGASAAPDAAAHDDRPDHVGDLGADRNRTCNGGRDADHDTEVTAR